MAKLFGTILDMSLTASVVIAVVLAARLLLKKGPKIISYALWAVVLFRLLCPVSLTAPVSALKVTRPQVTVVSQGTSTVSYLPQPALETPGTFGAPAPQVRPQAATATMRDISWRAWVPGIWAAGVTAMGLHFLISCLRLRRRLVGAVPLSGRVYLADHIPTPFVLGVLRPRIYLPSDAPEGEWPYILAHERHHIRRGDHIIKLLAYFALCLHWFNPLVWLAFLLAGKDMEMSCDEAVIRRLGPEIRADYAQSLLRLATSRPIIAGMPLAFGEGDTKGRVKNMANWKKPKIWVVLASLVLCLAVLAACAVNPGQAETQEPQAPETTAALTAEDMAQEASELADALSELEQQREKQWELLEDVCLLKCREGLEELRGRDSYCVKIHRINYGERIINDTSVSYYSKSGEDWVLTHQLPDEAFQRGFALFGYMCVDGEYYDNTQTGWDENEDILWGPGEEDPGVLPWIARFRWDDQEVRYISRMPAGNGWCLTLEVMAPYGQSEDTAYESYQSQFFFGANGRLERVENTFFSHYDPTGDYSSTEVIEPQSDWAASDIQQQYQRYLDTK